MNITNELAESFIAVNNITDVDAIDQIKYTFQGYAECMMGKPLDMETYTYTQVFKNWCDTMIATYSKN